jgi:flagellar basal body-associated protein FliL
MPEDIMNDDESVADSLAKSGGDGETGKLDKILKILLPVGIIVLFAAAGHFASRLGAPAEAGAEEETPTSQPSKVPQGDEAEQSHYDLEPIVINLNEPQVTRYLRVIFSLGIADGDYSTATRLIEKRTYEMKNWLIVYLSDLSLEEVRGAKNINRVRREVQDSLNDRLWPGERPLIGNVSLKEWIIQ